MKKYSLSQLNQMSRKDLRRIYSEVPVLDKYTDRIKGMIFLTKNIPRNLDLGCPLELLLPIIQEEYDGGKMELRRLDKYITYVCFSGSKIDIDILGASRVTLLRPSIDNEVFNISTHPLGSGLGIEAGPWKEPTKSTPTTVREVLTVQSPYIQWQMIDIPTSFSNYANWVDDILTRANPEPLINDPNQGGASEGPPV